MYSQLLFIVLVICAISQINAEPKPIKGGTLIGNILRAAGDAKMEFADAFDNFTNRTRQDIRNYISYYSRGNNDGSTAGSKASANARSRARARAEFFSDGDAGIRSGTEMIKFGPGLPTNGASIDTNIGTSAETDSQATKILNLSRFVEQLQAELSALRVSIPKSAEVAHFEFVNDEGQRFPLTREQFDEAALQRADILLRHRAAVEAAVDDVTPGVI